MKRLLLAIIVLFSVPCFATVTVWLSPGAQNVSSGSPVSVDINISGLDGGISLGAFDINVTFDPAQLTFASNTFGDQLDLFQLGDIRTVTVGAGVVNVLEVSLDSINDLNALQVSSFRIATLTFDTSPVGGKSLLTLTVNALGDASGTGIAADVVGADAAITSAVPEPSALVFLLIGLAMLGGIGRAMRRNQ